MADDPSDGRRTYTDQQFIEAVREGAETTREVAETLGMTRTGALKRLRQLRDDGRLDCREIGDTFVWSTPDS